MYSFEEWLGKPSNPSTSVNGVWNAQPHSRIRHAPGRKPQPIAPGHNASYIGFGFYLPCVSTFTKLFNITSFTRLTPRRRSKGAAVRPNHPQNRKHHIKSGTHLTPRTPSIRRTICMTIELWLCTAAQTSSAYIIYFKSIIQVSHSFTLDNTLHLNENFWGLSAAGHISLHLAPFAHALECIVSSRTQ